MIITISAIIIILLIWSLWISRGARSWRYRPHKAWSRIAYWAGDVYVLRYNFFGLFKIPFIAWGKHEDKVGYKEFLEALKLTKQGDILLATHDGYILSNSAIPGLFKHAAIITKTPEDLSQFELVEAISDGVVKRHPLYAKADDVIIVRPKNVTDADRKEAAEIAEKLVGCRYDSSFEFNIEEELERISDSATDDYVAENARELHTAEENFKQDYDIAFSCTETVATAWWKHRRVLGISRKKVRGRECIVADQFVNRDMEVIWTNVEPEYAKKKNLPEEGVREIEHYWEDKIKTSLSN